MIITFDCYGTLLDTSPVRALIATMAQDNDIDSALAVDLLSSWEDRLMYADAVIPYEQLIKTALGYMDMELRSESLFASHYSLMLEAFCSLQAFSEVKPVLRKLQESGHELVLMSNSSRNIMKHNLRVLDNVFQEVILPEQTHCYKPAPEFFRYAQKKLDLRGKLHLHVAKGFWWDIVPCHALGWHSIWINRDGLQPLPGIRPTYMLPNLANLPPLVQRASVRNRA